MSNLTRPPVPHILDCKPMSAFSFIKSEPKEPKQKSQSHFLPHIKYEVEEEAMPFIPIKIEPEEMALNPIKIEPEGNHVQENQESNINSQREVNHEEDLSNEDAIFLNKECKACGITFESDKRFRRHVKVKHQYKWLCMVCFRVCSSANDRQIHLKQNHTRDLSCTLCSKKFYDDVAKGRHFRSKHGSRNSSTMRKRKNM